MSLSIFLELNPKTNTSFKIVALTVNLFLDSATVDWICGYMIALMGPLCAIERFLVVCFAFSVLILI